MTPRLRWGRPALAPALALALAPSCTLITLDSRSGPPGLSANGLVEGHAAFGIRDEDHVLHAELFDGSSPGAIGEIVLWRLARLEVGLLGIAIGLGPIDLALGALCYDPELPRFVGDEPVEECPECAALAESGECPLCVDP
jgi:hypothetical protein